MKTYLRVVKAISVLGQLGFTLITPPLVLILLASWLQDHFELGTWVMLLALLIGLITSAVGAYNFYRRVLVSTHKKAKEEEENKEKPVVFYHHE